MTRIISKIGRILTVSGVAATLALSMSSPASAGAQAAYRVCAKAYVQSSGWTAEQCANAGQSLSVGAAGGGRAIEAVQMAVAGSRLCATGYRQGSGWGAEKCAASGTRITLGSAGTGLRLEAVSFGVQTGTICGNSYVQGVGWNPVWYCGVNGETNGIGTTGQNKRMEAVSFMICRSAESC
ncbi:hypothetical protein P3L51_35315 [Streptomyces sp. PSRA5]|uniref:hypothetical protein n=1 Tax=Streptomyces panacea TaxID=3035064 RepID=UPI00339CF586